MKTLFIALFLLLGILSTTIAQNAKKDLNITGTFRINKIIPLGKVRIYPTITNNSKSDYKDITYRVVFVAGDGTEEGSTDIVLHDYIGPGVTKKLKEEYIECPKDCKSISFSIVSGKKLG